MLVLKKSKNSLGKAISILKSSGIIICPTDTVYGFLADATNKKAVEKIYEIKHRPRSKPLPVFVKDLTMAKELAEINEKQEKVLKKYWPGSYTFILKRKNSHKNSYKNNHKEVGRTYTTISTRAEIVVYGVSGYTIALRIPRYAFLQNLLKKIDRPLVQTSVNISSQPPMKSVKEIVETFGGNKNVGLIIDAGNLKKSKPSKIIDLTGDKLTRLR